MPVFSPADEIRQAVRIEIDGRGAHVVTFDVRIGKQAHVSEEPSTISSTFLAQEVRVGGVEQDVELPVLIPIHDAKFASAALAGDAGVEAKRLAGRHGDGCFHFVSLIGLVRSVGRTNHSLRMLQHEFVALLRSLKEREIAFLIEHHEVGEAVFVPIDTHRRGAPLREQSFAFRTQPAVSEIRLLAVPFDLDGLRGGELRFLTRADVLMPHDFAEDGIKQQVGEAVLIPIGHGLRRVAPFGFAGALDAAIRSRHRTDDFACGGKFDRRCPFRLLDALAAQILDEGDIARRVAADEIGVAIAIPIETDGCDESAEFHLIGLLLEIARLGIHGRFVVELAGVLNEGHTTVFIAADQVEVAILVPVDRGWRDHFEIHREILARVGFEANAECILRLGAAAGVLEVGEAVEELAAEQVEVAVVVEVAKVRRRPAKGLHRPVGGVDLLRLVILRRFIGAGVAQQIHIAAEGAVHPAAIGGVGVVPAVFGPVADTDDEIVFAIAFEIDHAPHVGADFVHVDVRGRTELHLLLDARFEEIGMRMARREHDGFAVEVAHLHVLGAFADALRRLEDGHLGLRGVAAGVFEKVDAVVGFVRAVHHEIEVAIAIEVHRQRPGPQADTEIDDETWVVVLERRERGLGGERRAAKDREKRKEGRLHGYEGRNVTVLVSASGCIHEFLPGD